MKKTGLMMLIITIVLLGILLSGCTSNEHIEFDRRSIAHLSLSSDGSKLISVTDTNNIPQRNNALITGADLQIWDTTTGENILTEFPVFSNSSYSYPPNKPIISPNGEYYVLDESWSPTRINYTSTGTAATIINGRFVKWLPNERIITMNTQYSSPQQNYIIWNSTDFTEIINVTTYIIKDIKQISMSPDNSKIVFFSWSDNEISVIDISNKNTIYLWNTSLYSLEYNLVSHLKWSSDGDTIAFYHYNEQNGKSSLKILNASDGDILYNMPIDFKFVYRYSNSIISSDCKRYTILDNDNSSLLFYNLSGLEKSVKLEPGIKDLAVSLDWSDDGNVIAVGNVDGKIRIRNANTWELINILETPTHEYYYDTSDSGLAGMIMFFITLGVLFFIVILIALYIIIKSIISKRKKK